MAEPERGGVPEEVKEEKQLSPAERIKAARNRIEAQRLGEGIKIAAVMEALVQYAEKNPFSRDAEEIEHHLKKYEEATKNVARMEEELAKADEDYFKVGGDYNVLREHGIVRCSPVASENKKKLFKQEGEQKAKIYLDIEDKIRKAKKDLDDKEKDLFRYAKRELMLAGEMEWEFKEKEEKEEE